MLEIPEIYLNFVIDLWKKIVSLDSWDFKSFVGDSYVSLRPKCDDVSVNWTHQQYTLKPRQRVVHVIKWCHPNAQV